ncbi:hypothetical protein T484DRAFT_1932377 [Baffinella frigidus]|nr:hypothetical protein T484DRAFT_1932377 [Cryptophyta sp. CCMP2293]
MRLLLLLLLQRNTWASQLAGPSCIQLHSAAFIRGAGCAISESVKVSREMLSVVRPVSGEARLGAPSRVVRPVSGDAFEGGSKRYAGTIHPTPYTMHHTPYTLNPTLSTAVAWSAAPVSRGFVGRCKCPTVTVVEARRLSPRGPLASSRRERRHLLRYGSVQP